MYYNKDYTMDNNKTVRDITMNEILNNETLKDDYQRICDTAYRARSLKEAAPALFYTELMCRQLGYGNRGIVLRNGIPDRLPEMDRLHAAIWLGVSTALWASPCKISVFRPVPVYSYKGRLLKVDLLNVEYDHYYGGTITTSLEALVLEVRKMIQLGNLEGQRSEYL